LPGKNQDPNKHVKYYTVERKRYGVMGRASRQITTDTEIFAGHTLVERELEKKILQKNIKQFEKFSAEKLNGTLDKGLKDYVYVMLRQSAFIQAIVEAKIRDCEAVQDTQGQIESSSIHEVSDRAAPCIVKMDGLDLADAAATGLPIGTLSQVQETGYTTEETFDLIFLGGFPSSRNLSLDESDRAIRLIRTAVRAKEVFGNPEKAWRWLRKPKKAFNGKTCVEMLITEYGGREVENMLTRIEHGMAA
jgi:putative toxin-antitoxin system antitoxin component (TIGR02293 family)